MIESRYYIHKQGVLHHKILPLGHSICGLSLHNRIYPKITGSRRDTIILKLMYLLWLLDIMMWTWSVM